MKHAKTILLVFILIFSINASMTYFVGELSSNLAVTRAMTTSYTNHSSIIILNNTDFGWQAGNESWEGDGSVDLPYIIENYNITSDSNCIDITNVSVHFTIRNCLLTSETPGAGNGITFYKVQNATIEDNTITGKNSGLKFQVCEALMIENNTINDNIEDAIYLDYSTDVSIISNRAVNNYQGIYSEDTNFTYVINNNISLTGYQGVYLRRGINWTIDGNRISDIQFQGIYLWNGEYCEVTDNIVHNCRENGIQFYFSNNCTVTSNSLYDNGWIAAPGTVGSGIYTRDADDLILADNLLYNNSAHGAYIRDSIHDLIENNTIHGNYGWFGEGCGIYLSNVDHSDVMENTVYNNTDCGIYGWYSDYNNIINNRVYENTVDGIYFVNSVNDTTESNLVYDNGEYGFHLSGSDNITLFENDIGWNGFGNAIDDGGDNYWNTSVGNYWGDYDEAPTYSIAGSADGMDYHPWYSLYGGVATDLIYIEGNTGNELSWNSSAVNPWRFEVLKNDSSLGFQMWDGSDIVVDVDGYTAGYYNMTLITYHVSGHSFSSTVFLTVLEPAVTTTTTSSTTTTTSTVTTTSNTTTTTTSTVTSTTTTSTTPTTSTSETTSTSTGTTNTTTSPPPEGDVTIILLVIGGAIFFGIVVLILVGVSARRGG
ncbi:MAG: right-handed parallel beta-helix repeat-containing protein [Candidatus Thorarchaeota archaeon]